MAQHPLKKASTPMLLLEAVQVDLVDSKISAEPLAVQVDEQVQIPLATYSNPSLAVLSVVLGQIHSLLEVTISKLAFRSTF
jgi:hypothetical protein